MLEAEREEAQQARAHGGTPRILGRCRRTGQGRFHTEVFECYQRSKKKLLAVLLEMYVQAVSIGKVKTITEEVCGHDVRPSKISRIVQTPDEEPAQFAQRRLEEPYPNLILDARSAGVACDSGHGME